MKLDNRPKKLLVKGVNEAQVQAVKDWYETTGQLDTVENLEGGDLLVSFKSRAAAEQVRIPSGYLFYLFADDEGFCLIILGSC